MPAPINPKKRALMPSTPLRRTLRAAGHHLSPVVQIGKEGITEAVLRQLGEALEAHELVKVKLGTETPEDRFEAAERIGAEPEVQVAQVLGRTMLVYRRHPERPRFEPAPQGARPASRGPGRAGEGAGRRAPARRTAAAGRPGGGGRSGGGRSSAGRSEGGSRSGGSRSGGSGRSGGSARSSGAGRPASGGARRPARRAGPRGTKR